MASPTTQTGATQNFTSASNNPSALTVGQGPNGTITPTTPAVGSALTSSINQLQTNAPTTASPTTPLNDLSQKYGLYNLNGNPTVYDKTTGQAFTSQQQFFNAAGITSFNGVKLDTSYNPNSHPDNVSAALNQGQTNALNTLNESPETNPDTQSSIASSEIDNSTTPPVPTPTNGPSIPLTKSPAYTAAVSAYSTALTDYNNAEVASQTNLFNVEAANPGTTEGFDQTLDARQQVALAVQQMAASTAMDAAQANITNILKAAPVALGPPIIDKNGNTTQEVQDPTTGDITTLNLGNTGQPQGQYSTQIVSTVWNAQAGQMQPIYGMVNTSTGDVTPIPGQTLPTTLSTYGGTAGSSATLNPNLPASTGGTVDIPQTMSSTPTGSVQQAYANNNPFGLKYIGQPGATDVNGWAAFSSPEAGYQAGYSDILAKQTGGSSQSTPNDGLGAAGIKLGPNSSLLDLMRVYAPLADGNDPVGYADTIAGNLGISPTTPIGQISTADLAAQIAFHESGTTLNSSPSDSESPAVTAAKQQILSADPAIGSENFATTAFGYTYVNADNTGNPDVTRNNVNLFGNGVVYAPTTANVSTLQSIDKAMSDLALLEPLISTLPTDPLDPQRALNGLAAAIGSNPTLAKLQTAWPSVLADLQSVIGSGSVSRIGLGLINNPDTSLLPNVTSIQSVAQAMIDQTTSMLSDSESAIFNNQPPPIPNPTTYVNSLLSTSQTVTPGVNILNSLAGQ